jgi:hypothetical protein
MNNRQSSIGIIRSSIELNYTIDCFQDGFVVIEFDWWSVSSKMGNASVIMMKAAQYRFAYDLA